MLESIDFDNLEVSLNQFPTWLRDSYKVFLNTEVFDFDKVPSIFQEFEFYQTDTDKQIHGIIDLMVIYDDLIYIVDYKLKHINDDAYIEQLKGYKTYIKQRTNKPVKTYLYSIIDRILQEIT